MLLFSFCACSQLTQGIQHHFPTGVGTLCPGCSRSCWSPAVGTAEGTRNTADTPQVSTGQPREGLHSREMGTLLWLVLEQGAKH